MDRPYLPAGDYIISDPCYVFSDDDYDRLLEQTGFFGLYNRDGTTNDKNNQGGTFVMGWGREMRKHPFACFHTWYGDGGYTSNLLNDGVYSVDAGMIACIPLALVDSDKLKDGLGLHYHAHTFDKDFVCETYNGTFHFGRIEIYTKDHPAECDEYCECGELHEECEC